MNRIFSFEAEPFETYSAFDEYEKEPTHFFSELEEEVDPIVEFRAITMTPIGLRLDGAGFRMGGRFRVILRLNPSADCRRFEYRQFIKGSAKILWGFFNGTPPSWANWMSIGIEQDASKSFQIPGGLGSTFIEDGHIMGTTVERFGYRSARPVKRTSIEDRYLPSQTAGCEYRLVDTYGLRGASRMSGLRIQLKLIWQGRVIDTGVGNRIVRMLHWGVQGDDIIR